MHVSYTLLHLSAGGGWGRGGRMREGGSGKGGRAREGGVGRWGVGGRVGRQ